MEWIKLDDGTFAEKSSKVIEREDLEKILQNKLNDLTRHLAEREMLNTSIAILQEIIDKINSLLE